MESNNHKERFNLLDESSGSASEIQEFTLPKRKVKIKKKYRPGGSANSSSTSIHHARSNSSTTFTAICHSIYSGLKSVGVMLALVGIGISLYMNASLSNKVDRLNNAFADVEAASKGTPEELHDVHARMKELSFNFTSLKQNVSKLETTLGALLTEISSLKKTADNLQKSIATAPQLETLPKDVMALSENLATVGSTVKNLETQMTEAKQQQTAADQDRKQTRDDLQQLKVKMIEVNNQLTALTTTMTSSKPAVADEVYDKLAQDMVALNTTLLNKANTIDSLYDFDHDALLSLQNTTRSLLRRVFEVESRFNSSNAMDHSNQNQFASGLSQNISLSHERLSEEVDNLTKAYSDILLRFSQNNQLGSYNVPDQIQGLNTSFGSLQSLYSQLRDNQSAMSADLTHLTRRVDQLENILRQPSQQPNTSGSQDEGKGTRSKRSQPQSKYNR